MPYHVDMAGFIRFPGSGCNDYRNCPRDHVILGVPNQPDQEVGAWFLAPAAFIGETHPEVLR